MRRPGRTAATLLAFILWLAWLPAEAGDLRLERDGFRFVFSEGSRLQGPYREMVEQAGRLRTEMERTLGFEVSGTIEVRTGRDAAEFRRLLPAGADVPGWAAGVAFPADRLIVLRGDARSLEGGTIREVFAHELSHVVVEDAAGPDVPHWFLEGIAQQHAGEFSIERLTAVGYAALAGSLPRLRDLVASFPAGETPALAAYGLSYTFVGHLLHSHGQDEFRALIGLLRSGQPFDRALEQAYRLPLDRLEEEWYAGVRLRYAWIPLATSSTVLWFLMSLLFVYAWWRRRRALLARLAGMDDDPPRQPSEDSGPDEVRPRLGRGPPGSVLVRMVRPRPGLRRPLPGGASGGPGPGRTERSDDGDQTVH